MKSLVAILSAATLFTAFAVAAAGSTKPDVTTLHIEGMTCGSCATAVRHVIKKIEGVKDAKVSYQDKKAVVTYDASKVTPQKIAGAITAALPYKVTVEKDQQ